MTVPVNALAQSVSATSPSVDSVDPKMLEAAKDFEAVFVRQMLQAAKVGASEGDRGYGAMALDSLAKTITRGEGLGLARQIAEMLHERMAADAE